jgi:two-component system phosphate regulon sensor histidine kinase PhoR
MATHALRQRWPLAVGLAIVTIVVFVALGLSLPLAVGLAVAAVVVFVAALTVVRSRRAASAAPVATEVDRLHGAELALAAAADSEAAARELSKLAKLVLEAPAVVVIIDGVGDAIHMEAGDTTNHPVDEPGGRGRVLSADGKPRGTIAVAPRPGWPYGDHDDRILEALCDQMSFVLHRLAMFDDVRTERARLATTLQSSSDGIYSVDHEFRIRTWNSAMERITKIPASAAIGHHCCQTFRPFDEDGDPLYDENCPGRKGAAVEVMAQLPVRDPDDKRGEEVMVRLDCAFSPMPDAGYVAVVRDITDRPRIEDDKAEILTAVSYELRTPLRPIKAYLDALTQHENELDDEQRRHAYEVMLREEQRLERLARQLHRASSIEEAVFQVIPERIDWKKAVAEQLDWMRRQHPNHEFSLTIADDLPPVMADDHLTAQVLASLLSNAVKFSPDGSPIDVNVEYARERVFTTVTDEGDGIEGDNRDRIFEKFTLADHLNNGDRGVGVGLYIVRRSVEAMGGMVWVDDGPSGGSAFTFTLPAVPAQTRRGAVRTR